MWREVCKIIAAVERGSLAKQMSQLKLAGGLGCECGPPPFPCHSAISDGAALFTSPFLWCALQSKKEMHSQHTQHFQFVYRAHAREAVWSLHSNLQRTIWLPHFPPFGALYKSPIGEVQECFLCLIFLKEEILNVPGAIKCKHHISCYDSRVCMQEGGGKAMCQLRQPRSFSST